MRETFPQHHGNSIQLLQNGREIFPAMLEAIENASRSIYLETFIYWADQIGKTFAEALASRARDGVDVRVTLDWVGCLKINQELTDLMEDAGVKVNYFRPLKWYTLRRFNNRSHRKILVTDGLTGFIGGVGIADEWDGNAEDPDHWRDNHYRVTGPVVADLQSVFLAHWPGPDNSDPLPPPPIDGSTAIRVIASEPAHDRRQILDAFIDCLDRAQSDIVIITPYFMPCKQLLSSLRSAVNRGVNVQILTSGENTDRDIVRYASRHLWGQFLDLGIRIHRYAPTLIHAKMLLIDRKEIFIGSANFDCRSSLINSEANLLIQDADFAEEHWDMLEQDLLHVTPVTRSEWEQRSWFQKLKDFAAFQFRQQL